MEWLVEIVDHKSSKKNICDPKEALESDEPLKAIERECEEAFALESLKDLEVIVPGRESGYSSVSCLSSYSGWSS